MRISWIFDFRTNVFIIWLHWPCTEKCCGWLLTKTWYLLESWFFDIYIYFFYLGFLLRAYTNHRTAEEGGGRHFISSLPLPPASQTLRHWPGDYCRELTSAHSWQPVEFGATTFTNYKRNKFKKDFMLFWEGSFFNTLPLTLNWWKLPKKYGSTWLSTMSFSSVPKYLGLSEHVATFQFTIRYRWSYYRFFNGK